MSKNKLQELCHAQGFELPRYSTVQSGPEHEPQFLSTVVVITSSGELLETEGVAPRKRDAEKQAAQEWLNRYGVDYGLNRDEYDPEEKTEPFVWRTTTKSCYRLVLVRSAHCGKHVRERRGGIAAAHEEEVEDDYQLTERGQQECRNLATGLPWYVSRHQPTVEATIHRPILLPQDEPKCYQTAQAIQNHAAEGAYHLGKPITDVCQFIDELPDLVPSETVEIKPLILILSSPSFNLVLHYFGNEMESFLAPAIASVTMLDWVGNSSVLHSFSDTRFTEQSLLWHNSIA